METATRHVTAEDLLGLPDDGFRYELVEGTLRKMAPAGFGHGRIAMKLAGSLHGFVEERQRGVVLAAETGFKIASDPDTVRAPDVAFVRQERIDAVASTEGYWPGAPDLAVEVISPHDRYAEVEEKVFDWIDAGTRLVVVVNPRTRGVTLYRARTEITVLTEEDLLDGGDVVPGWSIPVRAIFA